MFLSFFGWIGSDLTDGQERGRTQASLAMPGKSNGAESRKAPLVPFAARIQPRSEGTKYQQLNSDVNENY